MFKKIFFRLVCAGSIISMVLLASCETTEPIPPANNIVYKEDGRKAKSTEFSPIFLDINADGIVDFNIFFELIANANGDHLYGGINPIGAHLIKAGPAIENNFLGMGFLIAEPASAIIGDQLNLNERWTGDHNTLVIRHTALNGTISYEGSWSENNSKPVGIQFVLEGKPHFGWLRLQFDPATEEITLIDYAYEKSAQQPIKAGNY